MNVIGITSAEQRDIFRILAAILHLGNVQFREDGNYAGVSDSRGAQKTLDDHHHLLNFYLDKIGVIM